MRTLAFAAVALAASFAPIPPAPPPAALTWHRGMDAVLNSGKPILLVQLLGDWDDEFC